MALRPQLRRSAGPRLARITLTHPGIGGPSAIPCSRAYWRTRSTPPTYTFLTPQTFLDELLEIEQEVWRGDVDACIREVTDLASRVEVERAGLRGWGREQLAALSDRTDAGARARLGAVLDETTQMYDGVLVALSHTLADWRRPIAGR
jgi:hypothetical protein